MIKSESLKNLLKALTFSDDQIESFLKDGEEVEVKVPDTLKILEQSAIDTMLENNFNNRKKAQREIFIKDLKDKVGLEFEGKTEEKFLEEYKKHILSETGQSVDEKVKSRDAKISELQKKLSDKETEIGTLQSQIGSAMWEADLTRNLPERNKAYDDDYYLFKLKEYFKKDDDGYKWNGTQLTDDKLAPLDLKQSLAKVFSENNWLPSEEKPEGKRSFGGGDSARTPGVFNSLKELEKHAQSQNIDMLSEAGQKLLDSAVAANPQFQFDS